MLKGTQVGAYRVLEQIGAGGMGEVWLAEHSMLGRKAALKVLHPTYSSRPEIVTRFFNEARAATAISDPGIVQIFDFGHHSDGSAYIVMELLDGEPLDKRLARLGTLAVPDALVIIRQVASSLGAAHARGIVHRDLKPDNIFLVRDAEVPGGERAKVLDFGIAKLTGDNAGPKTQTLAMMGTPMYMSPEQCRGAGGVDQRTDVYALGCVMCTLLTGRPPFDAAGVGDIIAMHLREAPPTPSKVRPNAAITPQVDALVLRCLAKDPNDRFASGTELAAAIGVVLGTASSVGTARITGAPPMAPLPASSLGSAPTTLSMAAGQSMASSTAAPRSSKVIGIVGVAAIALVGAYFATRGSHSTPLLVPSSPVIAPISPAAPVVMPPPLAPTPDAELAPRTAVPPPTPVTPVPAPTPKPKANGATKPAITAKPIATPDARVAAPPPEKIVPKVQLDENGLPISR